MDEYDTPMQEAFVNGYWEELSAFMRGLLNSAFTLRDNDYAYALEFKVHDPLDEMTLKDTVVSALAQIEEKNMRRL